MILAAVPWVLVQLLPPAAYLQLRRLEVAAELGRVFD
jgi:hypothetical protein